MKILLLTSLSLAALASGPVFAQCATGSAAMMPSTHTMVKAADIKWGPAPPSLPKGAEMTVLSGDPGKAGPFAIRIKAPPGFKVPRHWHPADEQITIISGDFHLSMGESGSAHAADFTAGDYANLPAKMQHEASTTGGVVVQVNSTGPFEITYVDPKDDPRNQMPKAASATK